MTIADRDKKLLDRKRLFVDKIAPQHLRSGAIRRTYREQLIKQIRFNIPPDSSVLEVGCGIGDTLAALEPSRGLGIDFSEEMIRLARKRHPHLQFEVVDAHDLDMDEKFDYVLLSNTIGDLVDIQKVFSQMKSVCHERTRIIITSYNYLWGPAIKLAEKIGIKPEQMEQNWIKTGDLKNLLELAQITPIKNNRHLLFPVPYPVVDSLLNDFAANIPLVNRLCVNQLIVGQPKPPPNKIEKYKVSVIIACKDEKGNIEELFRKTPKMGLGTEIIFVDGHSEDGTVEEIERCIADLPQLNPLLDEVSVYTQPGKGKGDAVRLGFDKAKGDILMILDADITVRPEDLPRFYDALVRGDGEFINGSRLVYPMEDDAMRLLNMIANHIFGRTFSWLLEQRLTDTLCGTKVLFKTDYETIKRNRDFFGDFDPFGDFDLLFGAAKQNLKIREVPIRYRNREYGEIKISRFRHGWLLLKMSLIGFQKFKLHRHSN